MNEILAAQLHYTSCRQGLSGYAGFQTRAMSEGISHEERREIEARCLYEPPRDLPGEPDGEMIQADFPKALYWFTIGTGKRILMRSLYLGQDYSLRWGNYLSHALVLPDQPPFWAVDLAFGWEGWIEENGNDDEPAPPLPRATLAVGEGFSLDECQRFLMENPHASSELPRMLESVFCYKHDQRPLVVREQGDAHGLAWLVCLIKAFPLQCQDALSFCSYLSDPRSAHALNATMGETGFLFDTTERLYQFHLFDFVTGQHSPFEVEVSVYSQTIADWLLNDREAMEDFHAFATQFNLTLTRADLEHVLMIFQMKRGDVDTLTPGELEAILGFVRAKAKPEALSNLLRPLADLCTNFDQSTPVENWKLLIELFAEHAAHTGGSLDSERVSQTWIRACTIGLRKGEAFFREIQGLSLNLGMTLGKDRKLLDQEVLGSEYQNELRDRIGLMEPNMLALIGVQVAAACAASEHRPPYEAPQVCELVAAYLQVPRDKHLNWLLAAFTGADAWLFLTLCAVEQLKSCPEALQCSYHWGKSLVQLGGSAAGEERHLFLGQLLTTKNILCEEMAVGLFETSTLNSANRVEDFKRFEKLFWGNEALRTRAAKFAIQHFPVPELAEVALPWLQAANFLLSKTLAKQIVDTLATLLERQDRNRADLAKQLKLAVKLHDLGPEPTALALYCLSEVIEEKGRVPKGMVEVLIRLQVQHYGPFMELNLPRLFEGLREPQDHRYLLEECCPRQFASAFQSVYLAHLGSRLNKGFHEPEILALIFWLGEDTVSKSLKTAALDLFVKSLALRSKRSRDKIVTQIENHAHFGQVPQTRWDSLIKSVEKHKVGWFQRVLKRII